jgi:hypothetical protein
VEKADWKDTTSWMDMEEAVMNFVEAYFDFKAGSSQPN